MPRVIGLTGNIACGKTSVGQILLELGVERYIDADAVVHRLYEPEQPVTRHIADTFGQQVIAADGSVDRHALGRHVFQNPAEMHRLEQIVHPLVVQVLQQELSLVSSSGIAIIDAVKLLEGRSASLCQSKWLVTCSPGQQIERLLLRNQLSCEEALARIAAQPDRQRQMSLLDEVIDNSGSLVQTRQQVVAAFDRFCSKFSA